MITIIVVTLWTINNCCLQYSMDFVALSIRPVHYNNIRLSQPECLCVVSLIEIGVTVKITHFFARHNNILLYIII